MEVAGIYSRFQNGCRNGKWRDVIEQLMCHTNWCTMEDRDRASIVDLLFSSSQFETTDDSVSHLNTDATFSPIIGTGGQILPQSPAFNVSNESILTYDRDKLDPLSTVEGTGNSSRSAAAQDTIIVRELAVKVLSTTLTDKDAKTFVVKYIPSSSVTSMCHLRASWQGSLVCCMVGYYLSGEKQVSQVQKLVGLPPPTLELLGGLY